MPARNALLRVLFGSLAVAAACGAVGILYADYDAIWRVVWTAVLTAVGSLLLLAATRQVDKPEARPAALAAVALVVAEYVLILCSTWQIFGRGVDEELGVTALFVALVGIPAVIFVRMLGKPLTRWAGRVGLVLAAVEFVLLLVMVWLPGSTWGTAGLDEMTASLAPATFGVVVCLIGVGTGDRRHWRWVGVAASAAGFALFVHHALVEPSRNVQTALYYLIALAAVVAHANVVMMCPLKPNQLWLRYVTIAASVATAGFSCAALTWEGEDDFLERLAGACGLVAGCGTVALAVLARVAQRFVVAPPSTIPTIHEVTVQCPFCQKKQPVAVGGARCAGCNLRIDVRVEEPRCPACGYSLLMLKGSKCPECGLPVNTPVTQSAADPATATA